MPRQAYADTGEYTEYNVSLKEISESIAKRRNLILSYEIYSANIEGKTGTGFPLFQTEKWDCLYWFNLWVLNKNSFLDSKDS